MCKSVKKIYTIWYFTNIPKAEILKKMTKKMQVKFCKSNMFNCFIASFL